jgi:hypothetical protein
MEKETRYRIQCVIILGRLINTQACSNNNNVFQWGTGWPQRPR